MNNRRVELIREKHDRQLNDDDATSNQSFLNERLSSEFSKDNCQHFIAKDQFACKFWFVDFCDKICNQTKNIIDLHQYTTARRLKMCRNLLHSAAVITTIILAFISSNFGNCESDSYSRYSHLLRKRQNASERFLSANSIPMESAQVYLDKFGWVEPMDWTSVSPRFNETLEEGEVVMATKRDSREINPTSNISNGLTQDGFANALRNFQLANGLQPTGKLDADTIQKMTKLRCGVPDFTLTQNQTSIFSVHNSATSNNVSENRASALNENNESSDGYSNNSRASRSIRRRSINFERIHASTMESRVGINTARGFKVKEIHELIHQAIPEGDLPEQSRVESIEGVLAALRKEKMLKLKKDAEAHSNGLTTQASLTAQPTGANSSLLEKIKSKKKVEVNSRKRRSNAFRQVRRSGWGMAFAKRRISWRLVREWANRNNPLMTDNEVWFTVKLAFRMWSEVIPREFVEDNHSSPSEVDILIGFGEGTHNRCPVTFNSGPLVHEYAHAWALPKAEIHFNAIQPFVAVTWMPSEGSVGPNSRSTAPISLLKVTTHEIGHALGLPHSDNALSIMNPYYQPYQQKEIVELSVYDRQSIQNVYGKCDISFDVVLDWVRQSRQKNGRLAWKYNTYFYRQSWYWLYENRAERPRYGDPKMIAKYWKGVLLPQDRHQKLDGAVHIRSWENPTGPTFFFKGEYYTEYDNENDRTKTRDRFNRLYPRRIADDFPGVPYPIDTVFFNIREELLYFFKNDKIYRFNWTRGMLLDSAAISTAFPGWGGATPLPDNIDAAYYSYAFQAYYFFKGIYYWKLADAREKTHNPRIRIPYNSVGPKQKISSKWNYICDVGRSELVLSLPSSS